MNIVQLVPVEAIPEKANIVNSHVLYTLKNNDDKSLTIKARIAPHGNDDKDKDILTIEFQPCQPSGIRIVLSVA